ncbi:hypothetical protein GCM10007880_13050 [Mesorhizobium amorphae]|nr:hypothetical protein GCM10007880_13050 [Mesorhizobium amorphae]
MANAAAHDIAVRVDPNKITVLFFTLVASSQNRFHSTAIQIIDYECNLKNACESHSGCETAAPPDASSGESILTIEDREEPLMANTHFPGRGAGDPQPSDEGHG